MLLYPPWWCAKQKLRASKWDLVLTPGGVLCVPCGLCGLCGYAVGQNISAVLCALCGYAVGQNISAAPAVTPKAKISSALSTPEGKNPLGGSRRREMRRVPLDGLAARGMAQADMPVTKECMTKGCYTMQKRAALPSSSAVNWASMWMGAGPELHGYTTWGSQHPDLPSRVIYKNDIFPTIFQIYRNANPQAGIGVLCEWDGIKYLVDTLSCNYVELIPDHKATPTLLCEKTCEYIKTKKPNLVALQFNNPDVVGHEIGWHTPEYYATLTEEGGYIGRIIQAVKEAGIYDDSVIIITSDHGGHGNGHGSIDMKDMETPFIIFGKGIRQGGEFQESMMQYDVAATMAHIFGIDSHVPQVWIGRPMLQIFE